MNQQVVIVPKSEFDEMKSQVAATNKLVAELIEELKAANALKNEEWYSTEEVVSIYKISKTALFAHKKAGEIKCWQVGRKVRWAKSELDKLYTKQ